MTVTLNLRAKMKVKMRLGVTSYSESFCFCHVLSLLQVARSHISLIIAADPPEAQTSWNPVSCDLSRLCSRVSGLSSIRGWWDIMIRVRHATLIWLDTVAMS